MAVGLWAWSLSRTGSFNPASFLGEAWTEPYPAPTDLVQLLGSCYLSRLSRLGTLNARGGGFRMIAEAQDPTEPLPLWLYPQQSSRNSCRFTLSLRLLCITGRGLVDGNGAFLMTRDGAQECA